MLQIVINQLDIVSNIFGGYNEIKSFISETQLNYLGSFPGDFLVVAPWITFDNPTDLTQIGFIQGKEFKVFNQNWDFLYSRISDGTFGNNELDQNLIINSYHGEYFHLSFSSEGITKIVLLWVAKTFDSRTKQLILDMYRTKEKSKYNRVLFNELLITPVQLNNNFSIEVFCLQGTWLDFLNPEQISTNSKSIKLEFSAKSDPSTVYLQPLVNYWYCFKQNNNWLSLSNLSGIGQDSWKDTGYFSYFFEPSLVNNSRFSLSQHSLLTSNSLYNNNRLQLKADLKLPIYDTLARPALNSIVKSSGQFINNLSFNMTSSRASVDSMGITVSLSQISSESLRSSVNGQVDITL